MSLHEELLELDTAIHRLSQGVNAVGVMSLGLMQARDPYADGFDVVYGCMVEAGGPKTSGCLPESNMKKEGLPGGSPFTIIRPRFSVGVPQRRIPAPGDRSR